MENIFKRISFCVKIIIVVYNLQFCNNILDKDEKIDLNHKLNDKKKAIESSVSQKGKFEKTISNEKSNIPYLSMKTDSSNIAISKPDNIQTKIIKNKMEGVSIITPSKKKGNIIKRKTISRQVKTIGAGGGESERLSPKSYAVYKFFFWFFVVGLITTFCVLTFGVALAAPFAVGGAYAGTAFLTSSMVACYYAMSCIAGLAGLIVTGYGLYDVYSIWTSDEDFVQKRSEEVEFAKMSTSPGAMSVGGYDTSYLIT